MQQLSELAMSMSIDTYTQKYTRNYSGWIEILYLNLSMRVVGFESQFQQMNVNSCKSIP